MKIICPKCGEVKRYEVTQYISRTVEFNKNDNRVGASKEEIVQIGIPYCINCGNTVVFEEDIAEKKEDGLHSIIRCRQCKYFHEAHYEEPGESPYIKYQCKNKYGMPNYTIRPDEDYCSRAEKQESEE